MKLWQCRKQKLYSNPGLLDGDYFGQLPLVLEAFSGNTDLLAAFQGFKVVLGPDSDYWPTKSSWGLDLGSFSVLLGFVVLLSIARMVIRDAFKSSKRELNDLAIQSPEQVPEKVVWKRALCALLNFI